MDSAKLLMLLAIFVYLIGVVGIGVVLAKKNRTTEDFYLGGRKLGPFVTAMSAEASDMSSWLLMGLPGVAYATGLADAAWTGIGLAIGTYVNWLIVAKRLRYYTHEAGNATTLPLFFSINLAMVLSGLVGSSNSIFTSPTFKKAVLTFWSSTVSML